MTIGCSTLKKDLIRKIIALPKVFLVWETEEWDREPILKKSIPASHGKADPKTAHLKPIVLEESGLDLSRSVSISTRFTVKVGASFIRTFHTGNLFAEDHNAFKIIVSNTNGAKYKYVIVNDHG